MPRDDLGARIRRRRKEELGLTLNDLARRLPGKADLNQVSRWERGIHRPSETMMPYLAQALEVSEDYLLEATPRPSAPPTQLDRVEWMLQQVCEKVGVDWAAEFETAAAPSLEVFAGEAAETGPAAAQPPADTPAPGRKSRARARK